MQHGIRTRTTSLHLCHILLAEAVLLVDTKDVLPDRERGHAVGVVRNTTESLRALSSGERLPPSLSPAVTSVHCRAHNQL